MAPTGEWGKRNRIMDGWEDTHTPLLLKTRNVTDARSHIPSPLP